MSAALEIGVDKVDPNTDRWVLPQHMLVDCLSIVESDAHPLEPPIKLPAELPTTADLLRVAVGLSELIGEKVNEWSELGEAYQRYFTKLEAVKDLPTTQIPISSLVHSGVQPDEVAAESESGVTAALDIDTAVDFFGPDAPGRTRDELNQQIIDNGWHPIGYIKLTPEQQGQLKKDLEADTVCTESDITPAVLARLGQLIRERVQGETQVLDKVLPEDDAHVITSDVPTVYLDLPVSDGSEAEPSPEAPAEKRGIFGVLFRFMTTTAPAFGAIDPSAPYNELHLLIPSGGASATEIPLAKGDTEDNRNITTITLQFVKDNLPGGQDPPLETPAHEPNVKTTEPALLNGGFQAMHTQPLEDLA